MLFGLLCAFRFEFEDRQGTVGKRLTSSFFTMGPWMGPTCNERRIRYLKTQSAAVTREPTCGTSAVGAVHDRLWSPSTE